MGQRIAVESHLHDKLAVFTGDRTLTGQDAETYQSARAAQAGDGRPGAVIAARLFEAYPNIDHITVQMNHVIARRSEPWAAGDVEEASNLLSTLFTYWEGPDGHDPPVGGEGRGLVVSDPALVPPPTIGPAQIDTLRRANYNAAIVDIRRAHESLWIMQVRPDGEFPTWSAGQYATLGLGYWEPRIDGRIEQLSDGQLEKLARRSYSIGSSIIDAAGDLLDPAAAQTLEFYVVLVEKDWQETPAILTPRLFLKDVGDRIYLGRKIAGRYGLAAVSEATNNVVMLATGTGEAPHNAMLNELLRRAHTGRIVSVCTARYRRDLAYLDLHRAIEARYPNYTYVDLTTREPENEGNKRYIQDLVADGTLDDLLGGDFTPGSTHVYLCGNPAMIGLPTWDGDAPSFPDEVGVTQLLVERGFTLDRRGHPGNVHFEEYW